MEKHDLTVTTCDTYLIISNCLNTLDALSADILGEYKDLVLDLEAAEISTLCTSKQELLSWLAESEATVVSHKSSSVY